MRSQELANLDDIIKAFDALDNNARLPEIVCSADDLLQMPHLLPLRSTEQVSKDVCTLRVDICSRLEDIDKRLQHPSPAPSVSENSSNTGSRSSSALCSEQNYSCYVTTLKSWRTHPLVLLHVAMSLYDIFDHSEQDVGMHGIKNTETSGCYQVKH